MLCTWYSQIEGFSIHTEIRCADAGKQEIGKIVSDLAERVSSGRSAMQNAHSANSELAGYSIVSRRPQKK